MPDRVSVVIAYVDPCGPIASACAWDGSLKDARYYISDQDGFWRVYVDIPIDQALSLVMAEYKRKAAQP